MHIYLLNTAALWFCLCCLDLVLFVDLFSLICFLSFDFVRVCLEQCYFRMNGMLGWAWVTFSDCTGSPVCPSGWGHTCICHSCHSHTHACPCEEWAALSPLLCSETFFDKLGCRFLFSFFFYNSIYSNLNFIAILQLWLLDNLRHLNSIFTTARSE